MSTRTLGLTDAVHRYLLQYGLREPEALRRVREDTAGRPGSGMQISPEQGQLMAMLVKLTGTRRYLEIGTFTGYSALAVALALPPGGTVVACERDAAVAEIASGHWQRAGVASSIELKLGPAVDSLDAMMQEGASDTFDLAFIDADKGNQWGYFERCLVLVRRGGLILIDNTLWNGRVADPTDRSADTVAIRAFNARIHQDERVEMVLLPIGDGLTLARRL
jgi:predicted O-methyltransferase YrrM